MNHKIPYGKQEITEEDIQAVITTLKSDFITQGPKVKEFEEKFAKYIGSSYAVAVANGTAALHLSIMALGIKPGQKVISSPITFAATTNAVLYNQGEVEFCDIDPDTILLDIVEVRKKLKNAKPGDYAGIIPVDFAGSPIQMDAFRSLADEYGIWLLEDACHAPGGFYQDSKGEKQNCGNGVYAQAAIFSFHPVKHIACGEGGMITTNDEKIYQKLLSLRSHGITKNPTELIENHGGWYHEMQNLGYNYRLNDIVSSLGISQLSRSSKALQKRRLIAADYFNAFKDISKIKMINQEVSGHAYHLFVIQIEQRKELYEYLIERNIFVQVHYIPVHLHPYYQKKGYEKGNFPLAEAYYENCLSLPIFPSLTEEELKFTISTIKAFFNE